MPRNTHARLQTNVAFTASQTFNVDVPSVTLSGALTCNVALTASQTLNIDIPTITVSGKITMNGALPPTGERFAEVSLRDPVTGDSLVLGKLGDASYPPEQIVAGTYDVFYAWDPFDTAAPPALPRNLHARIRSAVALDASQTFNVDIPHVTLSGTITVDGVVPTDTAGTVSLVNKATGDRVSVGQTAAATYATKQVVPGAYDITYRWSGNSAVTPTEVPRNVNHVLRCTRFAGPVSK